MSSALGGRGEWAVLVYSLHKRSGQRPFICLFSGDQQTGSLLTKWIASRVRVKVPLMELI